ncbi:thioredoxin-like protein [Limtongia smithiae]|uniref:thioredoxin-like protein n=1 Tax=Limtongia smithiae TaxID=1125753 RepID=UPI0034CDD69E
MLGSYKSLRPLSSLLSLSLKQHHRVHPSIPASLSSVRSFHSSFTAKMIKDLKSIDEFHTAIAEDKVTVIDFYATWCGPCKVIAPKVHAFSEEFTEGIEFYKIDVDEVSDVASEVGIRAMPTFMLFKNGQKIKEIVGANPTALKTAITSSLA